MESRLSRGRGWTSAFRQGWENLSYAEGIVWAEA